MVAYNVPACSLPTAAPRYGRGPRERLTLANAQYAGQVFNDGNGVHKERFLPPRLSGDYGLG